MAVFVIELLGLAGVFLLVFAFLLEVLLSAVILSLLVLTSVRVTHSVVVLLQLVLLLLLLKIGKLLSLQPRRRDAFALSVIVELVERALLSG